MRSSQAAAPAPDWRGPAAKVVLGADEVEFGHAAAPRWPCQVCLLLEPAPVLVFEVVTRTPTIPLDWTATVRLLKAACSCEVLVKSVSHGEETRLTLTPTRQPLMAGASQRLTEVQFDLVNAPEFFAPSPRGGGIVRNRLEVLAGAWRIVLEPAVSREVTNAFQSPLYAITHSCRLKHTDGAVFDSSEVPGLLDAVHAASSFAAGRWTAPVLVRGTEADGRCTWQEWGTRTVDPNLSPAETWFEPHHGQALAELMTGLARLTGDDAWKETILRALDWYVSAHKLADASGGPLILLHDALERLSAQIFVYHRKSLSSEGFHRLAGDDRIRLLLDACQIPASLPAGLTALRAAAGEARWPDGPAALASVRRRLVDASPPGEDLRAECGRLAAWYVELALLKLSGFAGEYANRTRAERWAGSVEPVPWAR